MRISINADPFPYDPNDLPWSSRGQWACSWIRLANQTPPFVTAYRLKFNVEDRSKVLFHVTADERYELYLDGRYLGRGSERGDANHWFFESYEIDLTAGAHTLVAKVWALGEVAPYAQHTAEPGFLLCPQEAEWQKRIGTGIATWEAKPLAGYRMLNPLTAWGTGHKVEVTGGLNGDWKTGSGEGWQPVEVRAKGMARGVNDRNPVHLLTPAGLPPMLEQPWTRAKVRHVSNPPAGPTNVVPIRAQDHLANEAAAWESLLKGESSLTIPAGTRRRVLLDLQNYVCAYPKAVLAGKGTLRVHWQESLYTSVEGNEKGNRDEVEGKFFNTIWHKVEGVGDTYVAGGAPELLETLWWEAGRYVELLATAGDEPLRIERIELVETHYPHIPACEFSAEDSRLSAVVPVMVRALEMCSHETYMDCPYYEQLQYVGDTRLQVLVNYTLTRDDRLPRKSLRMFNASRQLSGLTQSRYPNHVLQIIPPFSLWYVCMLHDFALYRGDLEFVRELMPGVRGVLDAYRSNLRPDGLLGAVDGWNFVDWVPSWNGGVPKDGSGGANGILNLQFVLALQKATELEHWLNEPEMAQRHSHTACRLRERTQQEFWVEKRNLFANDLAHTEFSEHAQCLALLTDSVPVATRDRFVEALLNAEDLNRTTIYFSHYLFEAYGLLGRVDRILARMPLWFDHLPNGLKTTIESPEPTRSDCHAWGAHPLFHYFGTILGIRPSEPGFTEVKITPQLGGLGWAKGTMPTPLGDLTVDLSGGRVRVVLPPGARGTLIRNGASTPLPEGESFH